MSSKNLIIYYSWSGNTAKIAKLIQNNIGGKIISLKPLLPYSKSYQITLKRARREIKNNSLPELENNLSEFNSYNNIFIGTPNWCSIVAPPVLSFLKTNNFSKQLIIPFLTHGGGGTGNIFQQIIKHCPNSRVEQGLSIRGGSSSQAEVENWLNKFKFN